MSGLDLIKTMKKKKKKNGFDSLNNFLGSSNQNLACKSDETVGEYL